MVHTDEETISDAHRRRFGGKNQQQMKRGGFMKIMSALLALTLSTIGITAYADTTEADLSKQIVSYTEYEEITDFDVIFALAEMQEQGIAPLSVTAEQENRITVTRIDENQVQADQILAETVYADGSVVEDRSNSLYSTITTSKVNTHTGGSSTVTAISKIYYKFTESDPSDPEDVKYAHNIQKGSTTVVYSLGSSTFSIEQELCVKNMLGEAVDSPAVGVHSNVGLNSEKFVYYIDTLGYNLSLQPNGAAHYTAQMYSKIILSTGDIVEIYHAYNGENDWPT